MKKLVINLERRTDRKEYFLKNNSLEDVEFITAIDGQTENLSMYPTRKDWVDPFLTLQHFPFLNYLFLRRHAFLML